jgi:restriction endonuclease XhoI-like protein
MQIASLENWPTLVVSCSMTPLVPADFTTRVSKAVAHYWRTLEEQSSRQKKGDADRGSRAAVTGGKQMDGFCELVNWLLHKNDFPEASIFISECLTLPGFYRPTKKWDMLVVQDGHLVAAIEFKSQKGPSFGNNFNNRAEEAIGTATDLWKAYEEKAFGLDRPRPWLGWVMLVEDCPGSTVPVAVDEPHFSVFPEFNGSSYAKRYELLLRKLVLQKLLDGAALLMSSVEAGPKGGFTEPASDLSAKRFLAGLAGHVRTYKAAL